MLQAVYISSAEAELLLARSQHNSIIAINLLKFLRDLQCAIWRAIINNDNLKVGIAVLSVQRVREKIW